MFFEFHFFCVLQDSPPDRRSLRQKEVMKMEYLNPLISPALNDDLETNSEGREVYKFDCHNLPICMSYGQVFSGCSSGALSRNRCSRGEKMQIRILNDMNAHALHKPDKPSRREVERYIGGK